MLPCPLTIILFGCQAIPSLFCIILQPLTYKIEVGVIAGLFIWAFLSIVTLRFTLSIPPLFKALPAGVKDWIAGQSLDAGQKKKLEKLGYSPVKKEVDVKEVEVSSTTNA